MTDDERSAEIKKTLPRDDFDYGKLDPGIRDVVRKLRENGFETTDSGDGVTKKDAIADGEAEDFPHVYCKVNPSSLIQSAHYLASILPPEWRVDASYSTRDRVGILIAHLPK